MLTRTGYCYFINEDGVMYIAESFEDEDGVVTTVQSIVTENPILNFGE